MSAYIANPEHFGILATWAANHKAHIYEWEERNRLETAKEIARGLALENIRSVACRYPNDEDGGRPGPCLKDADIVEAAVLYAEYFILNHTNVDPVMILKLAQCLDYQSCETEDWKDTLAKRQLDWIISAAIRMLPGYDDFDWEYRAVMIPEVAELYEKFEDAL